MNYPDQHPLNLSAASTLPRLSAEDLKTFTCACKCGIYKELHHQKLLSDDQLNLLLKQLTEVSRT